jgi:two-component system OmpR family response regulator
MVPLAAMPRILVVEDETELAALVQEWLVDELYVVEVLNNGMQALEAINSRPFDLIILDIMLPGLDGIEICKRYRGQGGATPIMMLTAKRSLATKELSLDSGADDYLTKPFKLRELSARVRALLRRPAVVIPDVVTVGDLVMDRGSFTVSRCNRHIKLLPKEFALLEILMRHAGTVITSDDLIVNIWGSQSDVVSDTVRSYVRMLRQKIDEPGSPSMIQTVHGIGYKIEPTTNG